MIPEDLLNHYQQINALLEGNEEINVLRDDLMQRQQARNAWNEEVLGEIAGVNIFDAANTMQRNIETTLEGLKPVTVTMEGSLKRAEAELAQKSALNSDLNNELKKLTAAINRDHSYIFQGAMSHMQREAPRYISNNIQGIPYVPPRIEPPKAGNHGSTGRF